MNARLINSAVILFIAATVVNTAVVFEQDELDGAFLELVDEPETDFAMTEDENPMDDEPVYSDIQIQEISNENKDEEEVIDPAVVRPGALDIEGNVFDAARITKVIHVRNGGKKGTWGLAAFCPTGSFGAGYDMKIEPDQGHGDDTALNAIKIVCKGKDGDIRGYGTSKVAKWGHYVGDTYCNGSQHHTDFLVAFQLQVQKDEGKGDTAANFAAFKCRGLYACNSQNYEIVKSPGHGMWGNYGAWSSSCPRKSAICGIKTRVQDPQGIFADDTALNDAIFYCCNS